MLERMTILAKPMEQEDESFENESFMKSKFLLSVVSCYDVAFVASGVAPIS